MEKLRYETDPHNRLIVGFRQVLDGEFKISGNNTLSYHVKTPLDENAITDRQIKFSGKWRLNADHDLVLTLDSWQRQVSGDELTLHCRIIDVNKNTLSTSIATRSANGNTSLYMLNLQGSWQADQQNRLTFRLNSARTQPDLLTFEGAWEVGENYELLYRYQKEGLVQGERTTHTLCFKGRWDIRDKARLSYILGASTGATFEFKTGVGVFKDSYIKYEVAIGVGRRRSPSLKRTITLSGSWKMTPSSGLVFELERSHRAISSIALAARARLSDKDTIIFTLKDGLNRSICSELELSRDIIRGNGQAFIKLLASTGEQGVFIGLGRRW